MRKWNGARRWIIPGVLLTLAALFGAVLGAARHFALRVLTPARRAPEPVLVTAIEPVDGGGSRVRLTGVDAALRGRYSFLCDDHAGHVRLGPVSERSMIGGAEQVVREVVAIDRGTLRAGARGRITGWWYADLAELGFPCEEVRIPIDGGDARAWCVRPTGEGGTWAIHVHGRGALPEETFRGVAPLARLGINSLVISYRNDPGAPPGVHGRYGLGVAEALDIDAAVSWALSHGAKRVLLFGWSMRGTASLLAAERLAAQPELAGILLESPALDWPGILKRQAARNGLPAPLARAAIRLMRTGAVRGAVPGVRGTPLHRLVPEVFAEGLRVPVRILASPEDTFVPWRGALSLAALRSDLVRLRVLRGEHVKLWNADPVEWEAAVTGFARELLDLNGG